MNLGYSRPRMDTHYGNIATLRLSDIPQYALKQHHTTEIGLIGQPEKDKQSTRQQG